MKRLLSFLVIFLLAITVLPARTYIVSVGIADYPGTQNDLRVSANDAKTIAGIFNKNGKAEVDCFVNSDVTIQRYARRCARHSPRQRLPMPSSSISAVMAYREDWFAMMASWTILLF